MTRKLALLFSIGTLALGAGIPSAVARSNALSKARPSAIRSQSVNAGSKKAITAKEKTLPTAVIPSHTILPE